MKTTDPLFFTDEQMHQITDPMMVAQGRQLFDQGAVLQCRVQDGQLSALVEDATHQHRLAISSPDGDSLFIDCDCDNIDFPICSHVCATLIQYGQQEIDATVEMTDQVLDDSDTSSVTDLGMTALLCEMYGDNVLRILQSGAGFICVMAQIKPNYYRELEVSGLPVALMDDDTLNALQYMQASFSSDGQTLLYDSLAKTQVADTQRLYQQAMDHLSMAKDMMDDQQTEACMTHLLSALLTATAAYAGMKAPPEMADVAVWIIHDAVPNGWLNDEQAGLMMQMLALAKTQALPLSIVQNMYQEIAVFVENLENE